MTREARKPAAYRIEMAPEAYDHLAWFDKHHQKRILDSIARQLGHQPTVVTRNRKPLEASAVAPWELRVGNHRVYFEVQDEPERVVSIVAIGLKSRERVLIGGIEVTLR